MVTKGPLESKASGSRAETYSATDPFSDNDVP